MEIVIVVVCVSIGVGLILVLGVALYRQLDELPSRIVNLVARARSDGERKAMTILQEAAAVRVGAIVRSLRQHEEEVAAGWRAQVVEAQVRARIVERQSSEAGVALSTAVVLVRELRRLVDGDGEGALTPSGAAPAVTDGRETVEIEPEVIDTTRKPDRPEPPSRARTSPRAGLSSGVTPGPMPRDEGQRLSEDELTCVATRPLPAAGPTLVSPASRKGGAR
jgi:hypothetical protein